MSNNVFDITDVSRNDMRILADILDEYVSELEEVMIIPDDIMDKHGKDIEESIRRVKKLIKKLKKGDKSVFRSKEELEDDEYEVINEY